MKLLVSLPLALALLVATALPGAGVHAQAAPKAQQFLYVLKVVPSLHDQAKWTDRENAIVGRHFARLKSATDAGSVIFAGRTNEPLDATFGLVVFEAADAAAAKAFMDADPAVAEGVMTATLHPYVLALRRTP